MSVVDIKAPPEFDTFEVLAAAVAIYEFQGGYFKNSEDVATEDGKSTYKRFANREILRSHFLVDYHSNVVNRPPIVKVTDEHRAKAEEIREYSKKEIINLLADRKSYATDVYEIVNRKYAIASNFGYIASAPFYLKYSKDKDYYKDRLNNIQSNHVANIGSKVYLDDFEIIRNNKSNNFPGYVVQGICNGNLFLFFSRYDSFGKYKVGDKINIEGKVKDHVMEQSTIPMTKLNRVYERIQATNGIRANSNSDVFGQWKESDSGLDFLFPDSAFSSKSEP